MVGLKWTLAGTAMMSAALGSYGGGWMLRGSWQHELISDQMDLIGGVTFSGLRNVRDKQQGD